MKLIEFRFLFSIVYYLNRLLNLLIVKYSSILPVKNVNEIKVLKIESIKDNIRWSPELGDILETLISQFPFELKNKDKWLSIAENRTLCQDEISVYIQRSLVIEEKRAECIKWGQESNIKSIYITPKLLLSKYLFLYLCHTLILLHLDIEYNRSHINALHIGDVLLSNLFSEKEVQKFLCHLCLDAKALSDREPEFKRYYMYLDYLNRNSL